MADSDSAAKQLRKLHRFFLALHRFAQRKDEGLGDDVALLIRQLLHGQINAVDFYEAVITSTEFPLRRTVIPFIDSNILPMRLSPLYQTIMEEFNNSKQPRSYVEQNRVSAVTIAVPTVGNGCEQTGDAETPQARRNSGKLKRSKTGPSDLPSPSKSLKTNGNNQSPVISGTRSPPGIQPTPRVMNGGGFYNNSLHSFSTGSTQNFLTEIVPRLEDWHKIDELQGVSESTCELLGTITTQMSSAVQQMRRFIETLRENQEIQLAAVRKQIDEHVQRSVTIAQNRASQYFCVQKLQLETAIKNAHRLLVDQALSEDRCANCGRPSSQTCSVCQRVRYCGRFCQHKDWSTHKPTCNRNPDSASPVFIKVEQDDQQTSSALLDFPSSSSEHFDHQPQSEYSRRSETV